MKMQIVLATGLFARITGLLRQECCANNEALLLAPCKSIHSFGMRCSMDVAFLNAESKVLRSEREVAPARILSHAKAVAVLERRSNPRWYWPVEGERLHMSADTHTQNLGKVSHEDL